MSLVRLVFGNEAQRAQTQQSFDRFSTNLGAAYQDALNFTREVMTGPRGTSNIWEQGFYNGFSGRNPFGTRAEPLHKGASLETSAKYSIAFMTGYLFG